MRSDAGPGERLFGSQAGATVNVAREAESQQNTKLRIVHEWQWECGSRTRERATTICTLVGVSEPGASTVAAKMNTKTVHI